MSDARWKVQPVDGGMLALDRDRGLNLLVRNEGTRNERRKAPRSLQVGLLTPCNLTCDFCYRDTSAPSRLTSEYLIDLLTKCADWGVLEVAFGGGEPLLFKGFVHLVRTLHEQTSLGVNFTTNGTLLTPALIHELGPAVGEIRVSAYLDNHYRQTLKLLAGRQAGLNLLVTPANIGMLELIVADALRHGARNVLLLGYKGAEGSLHLSPGEIEQLRRMILRMRDLPLRLDICWYPLMSDVPHLFPRGDCGAGDEFLVVTPDRAIQPCSFHQERIPFETFEDLQRIYYELRERRPAAVVGGCTRQQFVPLTIAAPEPTSGLWAWQAQASNNSGDWTIVGRFRTAEIAQQAAEALRGLSRAHDAFLASPEGQAWLEEKDYYGSWPTPPLQQFGEAHGFDWSQEGDGLWWEEDGCGAPVLTAGAVGDAVVVYHSYCMGLPEEPFRKFFEAIGGTEFGFWQYDRAAVIATAQGNQPSAAEALQRYLSLFNAAEYASDISEPPPWGAECHDPRLLDDESRDATLETGTNALHVNKDGIVLHLRFQNMFAGAIALSNWLIAQGYNDVTHRVDRLPNFLNAAGTGSLSPNTALFPSATALADRFPTMTAAELIEAIFAYHSSAPAALDAAVAQIPVDERVRLAHSFWKIRRQAGVDVDFRAIRLMEQAGPVAADWMRELWQLLLAQDYAAIPVALCSMTEVLPADETFACAKQWLDVVTDRTQRMQRLLCFALIHDERTIPLMEEWWEQAEPHAPVTNDWRSLAVASKVDWATLRRWLERGRPFSLLAVRALEKYAEESLPNSYRKPSRAEFETVLDVCEATDRTPMAAKTLGRIRAAAGKLTAG